MKKVKAILALILVACLFVTLFAACAKNEPTYTNTNKEQNTNTNTSTNTNTENKDTGSEDKAPADDEGEEPAVDPGEESLVPFEEEISLKIVFYDMRGKGGDYGDGVEAYANNITKETLNVVCDYIWIGPGDWKSKAEVALSSGERFDVMNLSPMTRVAALYPQGLVMAIDEYIEDYGSAVYELTKEYIGTYTFDGNIYGFPTLRNYCKNGYILMRTDMLEEMGLVEQAKAIDSWSDYDAILKAVKENYTDKGVGIFGVGSSTIASTDYFCTGDSFDTFYTVDNLGDSLSNGVMYAETDGVVRLYQESASYKNVLEWNQKWFDAGYLWPESAITSEFVDDVMKQGLIFSNICGSETGVEITKEGAYGFDITVVNTCIGMIKTSQPVFTGICVPITCEEPEAAVAWINELYTNSDLMNTLVCGIEGTDYNIVEGEVVRTENAGYLNVDFVLGNNTILTPLKGNGADFYDIVRETNAKADKSRYLGFVLNTAEMDLLISQLSAVGDQYAKTMIYGGYTEASLADYIDKLEDAGVRDYIAAAQEQLDAWLASH